MMTATFIVHDLNQAEAALDAADQSGVPVILRSALGAAQTIGPGVFMAITEKARLAHPKTDAVAVLDCGDEAGAALAALRQGCQDLAINLAPEARSKLEELAEKSGARIRGPIVGPVLDLSQTNDPVSASLKFLTPESPNE